MWGLGQGPFLLLLLPLHPLHSLLVSFLLLLRCVFVEMCSKTAGGGRRGIIAVEEVAEVDIGAVSSVTALSIAVNARQHSLARTCSPGRPVACSGVLRDHDWRRLALARWRWWSGAGCTTIRAL